MPHIKAMFDDFEQEQLLEKENDRLREALEKIKELGWVDRFDGGYSYMGEYHAEAVKIARQALGG